MHLYIAYKNYSAWSLRPWLAMKTFGQEFEETILPFAHGDSLSEYAESRSVLPKVPVLEDGGLVIPDSLAILEYLAERFPAHAWWPEEQKLRARARAASAEMHSGFSALRNACPMNCRAARTIEVSADMQRELSRLAVLWEQFGGYEKSQGSFLCGKFSIVDAMYAPMMWRVRGYGLEVSAAFASWTEAMLELPAMQEWLADARAEPWEMANYDAVGTPVA